MAKGFKSAATPDFDMIESADYAGCYYHTVDGETEWLNPPMVVGTEYRTVERSNGKVVYTKAYNFGALPSSGGKSITTNIPHSNVVSMYGRATASDGTFDNFPIPGEFDSNPVFAFANYYDKKIHVQVCIDMSIYTGCIFVLKYTK